MSPLAPVRPSKARVRIVEGATGSAKRAAVASRSCRSEWSVADDGEGAKAVHRGDEHLVDHREVTDGVLERRGPVLDAARADVDGVDDRLAVVDERAVVEERRRSCDEVGGPCEPAFFVGAGVERPQARVGREGERVVAMHRRRRREPRPRLFEPQVERPPVADSQPVVPDDEAAVIGRAQVSPAVEPVPVRGRCPPPRRGGRLWRVVRPCG
jgi:hypothetical protein